MGRSTLSSQVGKNGQHPAMILDRRLQPQLREDRPNVALDRLELERQPFSDRRIRTPFGHEAQDLPLSWRQLVQRGMAPLTSEQPGDDLGIDDRLAGCDSSDGVGEVGQSGHAFLEQVADPGRILPQEVDCIAGLDILREHEDRDRWMVRPNPARRLEAFRGVGRWHPNVDDGDVGSLALDEREEAGHVGGLTDDLEAGRVQSRRERLPKQDRVVGEDDADRLLGRAQRENVELAGEASIGGR
jgi:hypothetical protein